jgi:Transposase
VANLATLWIVRDGYVNGWDFFGAAYGVLALNAGSFAQGVHTILKSVLQQKGRVVFTGGESLIYGLVPGLLDNLMPWLLWSHLLNLAVFVAVSLWLIRQRHLQGYVLLGGRARRRHARAAPLRAPRLRVGRGRDGGALRAGGLVARSERSRPSGGGGGGVHDLDDGPLCDSRTDDNLRLADWLTAAGCTHVAMESTGVYWGPVYNLLEGSFELSVVNAQHVKMVPGRKTDVRDSAWLAQLLELGLLRRSFVPPPAQRELRDVVRYRKRLIEERAREANRVLKVLETANIKLGSVVTKVLGVSARAMLKALIAGAGAPEELAELAQRRLRRKRPAPSSTACAPAVP